MKLVIFDLDGTLLNTIGDLAVACNDVLRRYNLPEHKIEEYYTFVGNGIPKLIERSVPEQDRTPEYVEKLKIEFMDYYKSHLHDETFPYEGINELLAELQKREVMIAVASNKFQAGVETLLDYFFPSINFVARFGLSEEVPAKPNPLMVSRILAIANAKKEETLYVGDSNVDMVTAINSGLKPIGVSWGFRSKEELVSNGAWKIVDKPEEILDLL